MSKRSGKAWRSFLLFLRCYRTGLLSFAGRGFDIIQDTKAADAFSCFKNWETEDTLPETSQVIGIRDTTLYTLDIPTSSMPC